MKKFLSILLALAVGFTFTFGSAMSAFADEPTYSADDQKELLVAAYTLALQNAEAYTVDYDKNTYDATEDKDITTFTVSKTAVQAGVDAVYEDTLGKISGNATTLLGVTITGDFDKAQSVDVINVSKAILADAKTITNNDGVSVVTAAAWDDYKAALIKLVDSVDLSIYTDTKNDPELTAADGEKYETSKAAAAADIAYAKAIINNAKLATVTGTADTANKWNANGYKAVYDAVFGDTKVVKIKENNDDIIDTDLVTSLTYSLVKDYPTAKSEAADEANLAVKQAQAKATLLAAITTYENSDAYDKKQDEQIAAYKEAKTYLIENTTDFATTYKITKATAEDVDGTDYVALSEAAAAAKTDLETAKAWYVARGYNWDADAAAKALDEQLVKIYKGDVDASINYNTIVSSDLTAGMKAEIKAAADYSDIEAELVDNNSFYGYVYYFDSNYYYEAEWNEVKAVIDTFVAAVDNAKVMKDITDALDVAEKACGKIKTAEEVYAAVSNVDINTLEKYAGLTYDNAHAADKTVTAIYVTFGDTTDKVTSTGDLTDKAVYAWYIDKGARTEKEAAALYADACKVIDAYKTLTTLKSEAATVVSQIAALPASPTVADKDAVLAARDAYDALADDAAKYVTNYKTLDAAVKAVEKSEAYDVAAKVNALPTVSKVTVADKEAIKAAQEAYDAYRDAYIAPYTYTAAYDFDNALGKIQDLEEKAINDAYQALNNKYVADKLTADDAAAIKALQDAIAAYIDEYAETPGSTIEKNVVKFAAVVDALTVVTDADVKAYLNTLKVTVKSSKTTKGNVKVTGTVTVKATGEAADFTKFTDAGYTVKYKFYRSTKPGINYSVKKAKDTTTWTNNSGKKGTKYYYKMKVFVYDKDGNFVGQTYQSQCNYTSKVFGK